MGIIRFGYFVHMSSPFGFSGDPASRVVATAVHAGHDVRPEIARLIALDETTRLREEDPYTDRIAACAGFRVAMSRSRFEVDLNRSREEAVYRTPDDAWGLNVWRSDPPEDLVQRSLGIHDDFYRALGRHLDQLAATGPFVVLDVHAYNHRRGGPGAPSADPAGNPDVNVGTGSLLNGWRPIVDSLMPALGREEVRGQTLDVRENIRFKGRQVAQWVNERYPTTGCALELEFKKTFMDEWTGELDVDHLDALTGALRNAIPAVLTALRRAA